MSIRPRKIPSYRLHKPTGQAVVRLDGHDHYLGKHGTDASHEAYRRVIAEWLAAGRPQATGAAASAPAPRSAQVMVNDLLLSFWTHAEEHYRKPDGRPTGELQNLRDALRPLRRLYGRTDVDAFGPLALRALQQEL